MLAYRNLTQCCLMAVALFVMPNYQGQEPNRPQTTKSNQMLYSFPEKSIQCKPGDYIIRQDGPHSWKVYLVEDLFFLSRLSTLTEKGTVYVAEQIDLMDSSAPPKWKEIHLLVSEFKREFTSRKEAIKAVDSNNLGDFTRGLCRSINDFPKEKFQVYRKV